MCGLPCLYPLLITEEKKLPISLNLQNSVYSLYSVHLYVCRYDFIQKFANLKTLLQNDD